jgi:hypothetical protein
VTTTQPDTTEQTMIEVARAARDAAWSAASSAWDAYHATADTSEDSDEILRLGDAAHRASRDYLGWVLAVASFERRAIRAV